MFLPLLGILPGLPEAAALVSLPVEDTFREAKQLRYQGRWYEAAARYRRYLAEQPQGPRAVEARFWLADSLFGDQRWDEAAQAFTDFLGHHPDQRLFGKQARLNRIQCWGIRQGQNPGATPGLLEALRDPQPEIQVAAALQLAKVGDRRAVGALQKGLALPQYSEACRLALQGMGVPPDIQALPAQGRFLVLKIRGKDKPDEVTIRIALGLARAVSSYLSEAQLEQMRKKGFDSQTLMDQALNAPKGSELFSVEDKESSIRLFVE
ncbi:MAG: tetratricopeptide repeat protein [Acidobacteria bacterium]|nr:tetratricopeptide repeat protein [Acidobacteriota bacterium]